MNVLKKLTKKVENSKIVKNPKFLVIGLIIIVVLITLIYFIFLKYSPIMNFKYEGYAISGKEITENLLSGDSSENNTSKNIELTKIEEQGTIFKKLNDYFVGNKKKTEINLNYPIYINGNSSLYNLSEGSTLISNDFEEVSGYPNLSISEGKIYDGNNLERADAKEYIFVKTTDNIYINLYEIKVKTTANEYTIPVNSIIAFTENTIRYYSVNNNVLVFNQINDIDSNSNVQMVENNYTYKELLTKLGILQDESNNTQNVENTQTDIIKENTASEEVTENNENIDNHQQNTDNNTTNQNGYIKPEVRAEDFTAEVYTAKSTLHIKDPSGRIIEAPTFEIYKDGKIYLRRTFSNSGEIQITGLVPDTEYEVVGKYIYLNENNQKVENTFFEGRFTTKGYEELGSIDITKENGEIFSNKIQLVKVKITSDLNAEVIKGVNQVEIETGEIRTVLKNNQVNELLQGKEITIESSEGLKSDSKINYVIKFYDNNGVELKVNNNSGETRTSKEAPTVRVSLKEQDIVNVTLGLKSTNRDNVELENYKYIVTRPNGEIVQEKRLSENESELLLEDLDQNQYYKISIYTDYDLNDNRGKQEQVEIGNLVFATQPISTLGSLELTVENKELKSTTSTISYKINEERTDKRLIQILNELTISIKEGDNIVETDILTEEEIANLQQAGTKEIKYENLKSNTTYTIEITGNVQLGNTQETIPITYNYKEFITLKIPAKVEIRNQFVTGNIIDFDVRIEDIDNSVLNNKVRMELRNSSNDLIDLQELTTNEEYIRKTYEKLEENQTYTLRFYANQYNEGNTDETYKVNYLIKELEIITEPGISGSIGLTELSRKATGKNLVDMSSETKWYVYPNFNTSDYYGKEYSEETKTLTLGGNGNWRRAVYNLREYASQEVTMSFKAKAVSGSQTAYIQNSKTDINRTQIQGLTTEWQEFQYTLTVDSTGYLGFYIAGGNGLEIQELQVELGNRKTSYEEFKYNLQSNYSINLEDKRDEITTNDYYIKVYEDNILIKTDRYEEIPEENIITNAIKTYKTEANKQYKVELVINIKDREYVLSELEYNTQDTEEIKGIYNKDDFLEIQPRGHYIVLEDIDLRGGQGNQYRFGSSNIHFEGTIDFNGHSVLKDTSSLSRIIEHIGESAVIKNMEFKVYLNNTIEIEAFYGFFYNNYGKMENIVVSLEECSEKTNKTVNLLGGYNYGEINNFIIRYRTPLYTMAGGRGLIYYNYGIVKNGYVYGEGIEQIAPRGDNGDVNNANICVSNSKNGVIENIFILSKMKIISDSTDKKSIGNVAVNNSENASIKNVYSVDIDESITNLNAGPNIYNNANRKTDNIYYFDERTFNNQYELKSTKLALKDVNFQNQILNSDNAFNVDEMVSDGYYPQLNMPDCMPTQEYIKLPEVEDADLPDILSTEVLEQGSNSVKVKFIINNPSAETITNIKIENLDCTIESQEYSDGKSEVIALLNNPIICVSSYSALSITTKGAFNQEYTREYEKNERIIQVELFKEIRTVDDWIEIGKFPTENYMLMNDIDFMNQSDNVKINVAFEGVLEGNNHIIKNINVTNYLIYNITSTEIRNIIFENVNINGTQDVIGLFRRNDNATFDNIQIKNEKITTNNNITLNTVYIGGLAGQVYNFATVKNCSITNLNITNNYISNSSCIGGLVGASSYVVIQNCFVQDVNIEESKSLNSSGLGGIIGRLGNGSSSLENCYAIGKLSNTEGSVGGIVGVGENITLNRCFSKVDISSQGKNIGGIAGEVNKSASNYTNEINNNLVLGNLYTNIETENMKRIIGNADDNENNYAYEGQYINGKQELDELGGKLISFDEIFNNSTYTNKINFANQYDLSGLQNSILPKLLSTEGELLPNQLDNKLVLNESLQIENIEAERTSSGTLEARIEINNPLNLKIDRIIADGIDIEITRNVNQNGKTYIDFNGTVNKYYDNYNIEQIEYENFNGEQQKIETAGKIDLQFYKEIYSFEDWQSIDTESYQNYRLMADIDFSGRNNIKSNVLINRLETDGQIYALKNISLNFNTANSGLIRRIKTNLENIRFENIEIDATEQQVDFIGVIAISNANINNLSLHDITIKSKGTYVGFLADSQGDTMNNVNAEQIDVTGYGYVGGIAGRLYVPNGGNVTGTNITINSTGTYTGGLFGYIMRTEKNSFSQITISESNVNSTSNYVGGVCGYKIGNSSSNVINITSKNTNVTGVSYVGGIGGYMGDSYSLYADNVTVTGKSYVGGIAGDSTSYEMHVRDSDIIATGNYVGGIAGQEQYNMLKSEVINTNVKSTGDYVGAVAGTFSSNTNNNGVYYAQDCTVEGNAYVGGIVGRCNRYVRNSYTNSKVIATNHSAGGVVGYLNNANMTNASNQRSIRQNIVAGASVQAKSNVGGLVGYIEDNLYMPETYFYGNFIQADISSEDNTTVSLGIGNMPNQTQYLSDTYYYKYSTINGENPNENNEVFITDDKYFEEDDLKVQSTYISKMKFSSEWKFTTLANNKYPLLSSSILQYQIGIDLPVDEEHIIDETTNNSDNKLTIQEQQELEQTFDYDNKEIQTYSTYSVITASDGNKATRNVKLYVKDNNLYAIPVVISDGQDSNTEEVIPVANNIILDNYNGKEYETVLGSDGKMYDLKEPITYPENFVNSDIESIGNNLNSDVKEVEVTYKNGDKIKFNYQTGEIISSSESDTSDGVGLFDYLVEKISEIGSSSSDVSQEITTKYEESKELQNKLEKTSVEEAIEKQNNSNYIENGVTTTENNETNNSLEEIKYISMYNEETGEYEIYNEEELLDTNKEEVVSENEKIEANNLSEYYASEGETKNTNMGIVWIVLSIIGVGIILFVLGIRGRSSKSL